MKLSSGSQVIDSLLGGGFEPGVITTLYGGAGTGKSNISLIASTHIAAQGKLVVFVDTEGGFSTDRIKQLTENYDYVLKNIIVLNPASFEEQKKHFKQLEDLANQKKLGLVVVDSIVMLYRLKLGSKEGISETNKELADQLAVLSKLARTKNIPVLVTNQVYSDFNNKGLIHMVGGDLLKYWSKCIVKLEQLDSGVRKATIAKHRSLPNQFVLFDVVQKGLIEHQAKIKKKGFRLF